MTQKQYITNVLTCDDFIDIDTLYRIVDAYDGDVTIYSVTSKLHGIEYILSSDREDIIAELNHIWITYKEAS